MSDTTVFSAAWQQVTCADCGREYQCVPSDDYYHRPPEIASGDRTLANGVCTGCLLKGANVAPANLIDPALN